MSFAPCNCPEGQCRHPGADICRHYGADVLRGIVPLGQQQPTLPRRPELPDWMSRSYPYLSIARHFGLDYSAVLIGNQTGVVETPESMSDDAELELAAALLAARDLHRYMSSPDRPEETIQQALDVFGPGPVDALWGVQL